jgi:hypothetical protein
MRETLKDFISRRLREISEAEAPLREQLLSLADERRQIERAALAIGASNVAVSTPQIGLVTRERRVPKGTIKRAVLKTLEDAPGGMDALTILAAINHRLGSHFERTSLSPQLSRLKEDGFISLHGKLWKLAPFSAEEIGPAHFKSAETDVQGRNSSLVEPSEEVVHDNIST